MKITIESTPELTLVEGVPCRLWRGTTESGHPCDVYVRLIRVPVGSTTGATVFDRELKRLPRPRLSTDPMAPGVESTDELSMGLM